MARLNTASNLARPDDIYESLIRLHDGLDDAQSTLANAKLILLLANHIGDPEIIREAIGHARASVDRKQPNGPAA